MLNHPGASLSKEQIALGITQTCSCYFVQPDYYGYTGIG